MAEQKRIVERRRYDDGVEVRKTVENTGAVRAEIVRRIQMLISIATAALIGAIGLRVVLKLIAANPQNAFASFIYDFTRIFLVPFNTLVNNPSVNGDMVLEITSLIAMIVYALAAYLLILLFGAIFGSSRYSIGTTYVRRDVDLD